MALTPEEKAIPGELLIRLAVTLFLAVLWTILPFVLIVRIWRRLFAYQIARDLAWCTGFAALCALLLFL